jgi:asparagine synthase (glutamine-hydrolysing)
LGAPPSIRGRILPSLRRMTAVFPQLDEDTAWQRSIGPTLIASLHNSPNSLGTRRYRTASDDSILIYEGTIVPVNGDFAAHDAATLAASWHLLPEGVEGQFVIFRATGTSLELISDATGIEQIYYYRSGGAWLLSNHVGLLTDIVGDSTTDVVGVSEFLTTGSPQADRTLVREIHVIPPGQHWRWASGEPEPKKRSHFDWRRLSERETVDLDALGRTLGGFCRAVHRQYEPIECALTAGRDTRLLAALLTNNGIPADYYTSGLPNAPDVRIATLIASRLGLQHKHKLTDADQIAERWNELSDLLIRQYDGMVSLWQVADMSDQSPSIDRLHMTLWGHGALGRGRYSSPRLFLHRVGLADAMAYVNKTFLRSSSLIRREAIAASAGELSRFVSTSVEAGISPADIPDVVFAETRNRRWGGTNARKSRSVKDRFSPLCTAAFMKATFSIKPVRRLSEPFHYGLVKRLNPELHALPLERPWRSQRVALNVATLLWPEVNRKMRSLLGARRKAPQTSPPGYQARLLEQKCRYFRGFCLDRSTSTLWDVVDRTAFDRLMSPRTDAIERQQSGMLPFDIVTAFQAEARLRE